VDYKEGDTALRGYLAYDDSVTSKRPGVLLVHRRDGMTDLTLQNAEMVAKQGYVVFAPDIFGRDHQPKDVPQQIEASGSFNKNRPLMRARTQAGFDILRQNPQVDTAKLAVIGYCFGGTVAIEFAEAGAPVLGTVTIHGSFRDFTPGAAKNIKGRVLSLLGAEDPVDARHGLVEQNERWLRHHDARELQELALAARQGAGVLVREVIEVNQLDK
jgi:dienelactone hydrolase